jgi:hypothetical protein
MPHSLAAATASNTMEGQMNNWKNLPVLAALLLALAAAMMSSDPNAVRDIISFSAEVLKPQIADLGQDPGYLLGTAPTTDWLLPPSAAPVLASRD